VIPVLERINDTRKIGYSKFQKWILIDYFTKFCGTAPSYKGKKSRGTAG
jgi:hypothetical protein